MSFYRMFQYNGVNFAKKFTKEFLNHVCGGHVDIDWDKCTRKRLVINSPNTAHRLLNINQRVYWPNGEIFICYPISTTYVKKYNKKKLRTATNWPKENTNNVSVANIKKEVPVDTDNWYESGSIVDVQLCYDDDNDDNYENVIGNKNVHVSAL
ncbi:LEF-6 [Adoxophyes orana nucleopolyhedrovirus]|uniref:LEF-6 n=1 Tax=Adoxophyes orana nucleopolyhedrovirus TaxID=542343 RepID=UPI0001829BED|nr:LEF-6 [Adoxophyes orana nucleopolyhedrovirus]ACF05320.1 LEF-6 [Adoxophyes orana nucleopolyhedrovirus]